METRVKNEIESLKKMYMYYKPFERVPYNGEDFHHRVVGIKHKISRSRFIRSNKKRGKK